MTTRMWPAWRAIRAQSSGATAGWKYAGTTRRGTTGRGRRQAAEPAPGRFTADRGPATARQESAGRVSGGSGGTASLPQVSQRRPERVAGPPAQVALGPVNVALLPAQAC